MPSAVRIKTASGWQDIALQGPAGPPGSFTMIAEQVMAADGFPTFSAIPQTFAHLLMMAHLRATAVALTSGIACRLNSDVGANYTFGLMGADDLAAANAFSGGQTFSRIGICPAGSAGANNFGSLMLLIPNYSAARMHALIAASFASIDKQYSRFGGGLYTQANPVTALQVYAESGNLLLAGSRFTLYGLGALSAPSWPIPIVSVLPASPSDGQEIYYLADATNGVVWHLRYRAGSSSAYKWEYLGGAPLIHEVATGETQTTANTWSNLATNGPLVTVPLAGDYEVDCVAKGACDANQQTGQMGPAIGDTNPALTAAQSSPPSQLCSLSIVRRMTGLVAGNVLKMRYYANTTGWSWSVRLMRVRPVRVG